jgi:hypothetical protein
MITLPFGVKESVPWVLPSKKLIKNLNKDSGGQERPSLGDIINPPTTIKLNSANGLVCYTCA